MKIPIRNNHPSWNFTPSEKRNAIHILKSIQESCDVAWFLPGSSDRPQLMSDTTETWELMKALMICHSNPNQIWSTFLTDWHTTTTMNSSPFQPNRFSDPSPICLPDATYAAGFRLVISNIDIVIWRQQFDDGTFRCWVGFPPFTPLPSSSSSSSSSLQHTDLLSFNTLPGYPLPIHGDISVAATTATCFEMYWSTWQHIRSLIHQALLFLKADDEKRCIGIYWVGVESGAAFVQACLWDTLFSNGSQPTSSLDSNKFRYRCLNSPKWLNQDATKLLEMELYRLHKDNPEIYVEFIDPTHRYNVLYQYGQKTLHQKAEQQGRIYYLAWMITKLRTINDIKKLSTKAFALSTNVEAQQAYDRGFNESQYQSTFKTKHQKDQKDQKIASRIQFNIWEIHNAHTCFPIVHQNDATAHSFIQVFFPSRDLYLAQTLFAK